MIVSLLIRFNKTGKLKVTHTLRMGIVKNLFKFYFVLFVILSHTAVLTCRYAEDKVKSKQFDYLKVNKDLMQKCPKVSQKCSCITLETYTAPR